MKHILIVVDMQTDFVDGALGTPEAVAILENVTAKIKAYADEQRKTTKANCVCVPPNVAEGIIRKFYGLPERSTAAKQAEPAKQEDSFLNLEDFL